MSQRKWVASLANGSVGHSHANALAEPINGLYKAEVIWRRGPWRNFEAVELATLKWVDRFNHRRLVERIGNIPPAEAGYYAQIEEPAMAKLLKQNGLRQTRGGSVLGMIELRSAFVLRSFLCLRGPIMKNPFRAFLKASRMLSAALVLQRMALSPEPTPKRAKTRAKPPTS